MKITLILATSISDITSQYVCITHLHSNLEYANGKLRSFLPHDFNRFMFAKQVDIKITDSVSVYNKCRPITRQTTIVIVILFFTSVSAQAAIDGYNLNDDRHWTSVNNCAMPMGRDPGRSQRRRNASQKQEKREKAGKYDKGIGEKQVSRIVSGYCSFDEGHKLLVKCILSTWTLS